jgi:hypothetical protein
LATCLSPFDAKTPPTEFFQGGHASKLGHNRPSSTLAQSEQVLPKSSSLLELDCAMWYAVRKPFTLSMNRKKTPDFVNEDARFFQTTTIVGLSRQFVSDSAKYLILRVVREKEHGFVSEAGLISS